MDYIIIKTRRYGKTYQGGSVTGNLIEIIGEEVIQDREMGEQYECYLYNIVGYTPKNGKPFISRKENIICLEPITEEPEWERRTEYDTH